MALQPPQPRTREVRPRTREVRIDGFPPIRSIGARLALVEDFYHFILTRPWWQFVGLLAAGFVAINTFFALLYLAAPGCIANARPGSFEDAFYFSVQSLATIGYGGMFPATRYGHVVVTVEAFLGILSVAVITGLTFAKFARPTARVLFSARVAAPKRYGVPHLMFRMANERHNLVVEAELTVIILVDERTPEGETLRRPIPLKLVRDRTQLLVLTWTAMHPIDADSPFHGEGALERLRAQKAEIYLSLKGQDETISQPIHARMRYQLDDIAWGHRFADVIAVEDDGRRVVDYRWFHDVVPVDPAAGAEAGAREIEAPSTRAAS